ncbi:MAG: POT family proton-dependent oligopeptide transporter [Myxococcota bacterium]|jgi:POT family proton-dependent oligopeptide transporter
MANTAAAQPNPEEPTLFGHPTGLFMLFFAEMWERFSYYGMRALLVFYMIKGFLSYGDGDAYKIYGAYTALVYMTPFFGGMLADRLLGPRRAIIFGGLLMAAGHLIMSIENSVAFFMALALLIVGNGFFKPNISTVVGGLYADGDPRRDGGFTIFYMGINLGAAMAPLLCGYVGETYGWHNGFRLATVGMLVGLAVFWMPTRLAQVLILLGACATAFSMVALQDNLLLLLVNGFVALALLVSGVSAFVALGRGGLAPEVGGAPDEEALRKPIMGIPAEYAVYLGTLLVTPILAALVYSNRTVRIVPDELLAAMAENGGTLGELGGTLLGEVSTPTGLILAITGVIAIGYLMLESIRAEKVERERLWVVLSLMFFSLLFWAFFEQAGSSVNNFTDRNVDRVAETRVITQAEVGQTIAITMNQEQLGYANGGDMITINALDDAREAGELDVQWKVEADDVGMGVGGSAIPASTFQSANPIFILLFGLPFSFLWVTLGRRGIEPNTSVKFALGLLQLGLGFGALWYGAQVADGRGMVGMHWLLLGYLLHTTGELCLSPVGLSMVTKLSPKRLVSTAMGAWFLATAFSSYLAAVIATFTGVSHGGGGGGVPIPLETVNVYGDVFGTIGLAAAASALLLFMLSPILTKWTHGAG